MTTSTSPIEASPGGHLPQDPDWSTLCQPTHRRPPRQPDPPHTPRKVAAVVAVLSLAVFMASLDLLIVNLAFPYIAREYRGASLSTLS